MAEGQPAVYHETVSKHSGPPLDSSANSYAFLVHSTSTLTNNLPPDVDDKPLARQKRRRTSPEDQAILEAEYLRNPKPDKAARMDIVSRVALGEKEVQIWFQNRRQSSRRKSRPLLPHEIAQYQSSHSMPLEYSSPAVSRSFDGQLQLSTTSGEGARMPPDNEGSNDQAGGELQDGSPIGKDLQSQQPPSSQDSTGGSLGYLANRRSTAGPRPIPTNSQDDRVFSSQTTQTESQDAPARPLKKSTSSVRLSMTSDGVAKIVTQDSSSPSPPRASAPPPSSAPAAFTSSMTSATSLDSEQLGASQGSSSSLRRKPSGRSRDSRAWEFWCDKDARSELEEKADQEASGSAADAIGLLRSNSGRGILQALNSKRNSPAIDSSAVKKAKLGKVPLLQRSSSLNNRQPARRHIGDKGVMTPNRKLKKAASGLGIVMPGNDSDKENWSPDRHVRSERGGENDVDAVRTKVGGSPVRPEVHRDHSSSEFSRAIENPEADEEIARFMGRERKSQSVSEEEELDCVQGLLSLSQGNWK